MKTNLKQSTDKTRLGAVCRFIGVLLGLLVFIWLPPAEVTAAGSVSGVVRDSETTDLLPGVTITVEDVVSDPFDGPPFDGPLIGSFSGSLSTESKGSPEEGEYSFDNPWCDFIFIEAELDGYEPFRSIEWFGGSCTSDIKRNLDIDMMKHTIPYSTSMRPIKPSGLIENPRVFRWTPSKNPAVVSYRMIISEDPNVYYSDTGIDVTAPQAGAGVNLGHSFWRVFGLDQSGNPVEQTRDIFEVWSDSEQGSGRVISGLVKSDRNQAGLVGAQVVVSSAHENHIDSSMVAEFNGEYVVIAALFRDRGEPIPGPIVITSIMPGFHPTTRIVKEGWNILDLPMRLITDKPFPSLQLRSPPDGQQTDPVTVFRWTRLENPEVHSYRLQIYRDEFLNDRIYDLPSPEDNKIIAPQIAMRLDARLGPDEHFFWRVIALDPSGNLVEQSQNISRSFYRWDFTEDFTVITGRVKSDLNPLGEPGARVAVSSALHSGTLNNIVETEFNGEYSVIARTTDSNGDPIPFPIEITSTKVGFQPITVALQKSEEINGTITLDLVMIGDTDGDGISDAAENASASTCLNANDADTDDDGILDGNEDADHDGAVDAFETDPCKADTDDDGLLDGTEIGLTAPQGSGSDTDLNVFVPDADPTTNTNPRDNDSDNDGLLDGEEDLNHDGRVDTGETDPSSLRAGALPAILSLLLGD